MQSLHKSLVASLFIFVSHSSYAADIQVLSAVVKDKPIENAKVIIQRTGETSQSAVTQANGQGSVAGVDDENSLLIIKKDGYSTLIAKCPCDDMTYALSPVMENLDGLRVVLTWGRNPQDLDSHLTFPGNKIYFDDQRGEFAHLDVDDTNSFGPETITIDKKLAGKSYVYAVHNFSDRLSKHSSDLSRSQARVEVYVGQTLMRTYKVNPEKKGTAWVVFGIDGNGAFHDIEQYVHMGSSSLSQHLDNIINADSFESHELITPEIINNAKRLNTQGEKLYHQGELEQAMYAFQEAVNLYPDFGQAYSNLGLTFQKRQRIAEAIWANKKAIELASGRNKNTIQASSYYNIARIYEASSFWQDALDHYQQALNLKQHSAYTKGIARMQEKLKN